MSPNATVLVKTLIGLCEGQCGGEVTLTTDGVREAYAVVETDRNSRFLGQDCDGVSRDIESGTITVQCAAVDPESDDRCDGSVAFTKAALDGTPYEADKAAAHMIDMDVE